MPDVSFVGLLIVAIVAFLAPLLLGLSPARRLPSVVVEIVAGIIIGPSVLGWHHHRPIRPRLGQGRSANFDPLGVWTGLPPLPRRFRSRA